MRPTYVISIALAACQDAAAIGPPSLTSAKNYAAAVRQTSLTYVRMSAPVALTSAVQIAVSSCTRALDLPDVPLLISSTGFMVNIVLDLLFISSFHVGSFQPTIFTQAGIRLACDMVSAIAGLVYFIFIARRMQRRVGNPEEQYGPQLRALPVLARPAVYTFAESVIRNSIYLWIVSRIISLGQDYATAWGVFNTIRWGLVMVPVQALEASTLTFVGHRWGRWRAEVGARRQRAAAGWRDIKIITLPAMISCLLALSVEVPLCIFLSLWGEVTVLAIASHAIDILLERLMGLF